MKKYIIIDTRTEKALYGIIETITFSIKESAIEYAKQMFIDHDNFIVCEVLFP